MNTLINEYMFISPMFMVIMSVWVMYYFEGVTTWYQSVPGLDTLGTWEVVSSTMGSSRLLETYV